MQTDSLQSLPLPTASPPPFPKAGGGGRGAQGGRDRPEDGEDGKKIQLNYHCFNMEISSISLMLAETKFITLLHSGKVQGGALGAGRPRPGDV